MAALKRRAHQVGITDALEREVHAATGELNDDVLDGLVIIGRVDAIRRAELFRQFELVFVDINGDDATGFGERGALNSAKTDAAKTEYSDGIALLHFSGIQNSSDSRRNATTQKAYFFKRCFFADFGNGYFRKHGVLAKRRSAHVMKDWLAVK